MVERSVQRLLSATGVVAGYDGKQVLSGIDLSVGKGEVVAIIGHNGAGKTTLLKALFGLVKISAGEVILDAGKWQPQPAALLAAGVAYVPQGNRVFPALTVRENLRVAAISVGVRTAFDDGVERVMAMFPALRARLNQIAGTLSGGEQQMLALGRALMFNPQVLLLDEPSLGLSPPLVTKALALLESLARDRSLGIVVVEQKVREVLRVSTYVYVLRRGVVAFHGAADRLLRDEQLLRETYL